MRAAASRAIIAVGCLCLLGTAAGCATATKRHYLEHLSLTVVPTAPDRDLALALAETRGTGTGTAIAGVDTSE